MKNKIKQAGRTVKNKAASIITSVKGMSQTTETVLLIVLVVAVIGAFFAPAITSWFSGVMSDLATHTEGIFNFAP
ncbi:hypothetical protein [Tannockella kyphosi]|uniref:hypothetical protein n=1 Tax=Tannockella kyphosi TaxID=2899121 RepID=UPI002011393E|nr:hypothetical protein [Tannockella kyphosi]